MSRAPVTLSDVRKRVAARLTLLAFLRESSRAFGLGEIPRNLAHGSFFVVLLGGISLDTWRVNDGNGFDWQSNVEVSVAYKNAPHISIADHDAALVWSHQIINHLVRQTEDWPIDLRIKGSDVTLDVAPDASGQFIILKVGIPVRHNLSITEAA